MDMERPMEPPPYTEQPQPGTQTLPSSQAEAQPVPQTAPQGTPQAQIRITPAQTYQPYPTGPTQPPLYPPMPQTTGNATVVIHTTLPQRIPVGRDPTFVRCPSCQNDVVTKLESSATRRTHMWALILCCVGLWPCVCVPYCMDSCKTSNHYCPACNAFIGSRAI